MKRDAVSSGWLAHDLEKSRIFVIGKASGVQMGAYGRLPPGSTIALFLDRDFACG